MSTNLRFSQAVEGHELTSQARHLSENTLNDYRNTYRKFLEYYPQDPYINEISSVMVERFLADQIVKEKTVLNYHVGLSALWSWAVKKGFITENILHTIEAPDVPDPDIQPLSESDVRLILSALSTSRSYKTHGSTAAHSLHEADRNRAIVLTLLDTGIRASELCNLEIRNMDIRNPNKTLEIEDGKGKKDRRVPISSSTAQAIWKYLTSRPDAKLDDPLFVTKKNKKINRNNLGDMLEAAAKRVGVSKANPHKFRHTFAINYLRNGGNVYTLQSILGHEDLETCLHYLAISQMDVDNAHRRASPVDHWRL